MGWQGEVDPGVWVQEWVVMWIWQMVVGELVGFHQGKLDGWLLG